MDVLLSEKLQGKQKQIIFDIVVNNRIRGDSKEEDRRKQGSFIDNFIRPFLPFVIFSTKFQLYILVLRDTALLWSLCKLFGSFFTEQKRIQNKVVYFICHSHFTL